MKTKILFFALALFLSLPLSGQQKPMDEEARISNDFLISLRGGYDILQWYENGLPYTDYKGGMTGGLSLDYFWKYVGVGADADYIRNRPKSTYPTGNLWYNNQQLTDFSLTEESISRWFYGLGPSFRYINAKENFASQLHVRGGMGHIKGGLMNHQAILSLPPDKLLNYHAGYDADFVFSGKAQLMFTYFVNDWLGFNMGGYYIHHFGAEDRDIGGFSSAYEPVMTGEGIDGTIDVIVDRPVIGNAIKHDISSFGAFAGATLRFGGKPKLSETPPCLSCTYGLTVTAKDKYTGDLLVNTDVALINLTGEIVQTGTTNAFGVVTFSDVIPDNYAIEGILHDIKLESNSVSTQEFVLNETIQKAIVYANRNFIILGRAFVCNTDMPLEGVTVVLENTEDAFRKTTSTNEEGRFVLHMPEMGRYSLYGRKANFFSQMEEVNANNYDRDKNLFVRLEICAQEVSCDENIQLENIHYDLDKFFIRDDAKPELNKLVQFMKDNPTVKVEVGSHTDCRGTDEYNMRLSQNRANAAVDYVVSKGISRSRITGIGYGESRLLNHCRDGVSCSEAEHQVNRRTAFRVICP